MTISIGTPLIDPYGNRGFIAEIKEAEGGQFVLSRGMQAVRHEFVICWEGRDVSTLSDGIAETFIKRAALSNVPPVPESEIPARLAEARKAEADRRAAREREKDEARRIREEFEADAANRIPSWAQAVIVAELVEDQSDSMTDYFASTTRRTVILAFSRHKRDLFAEMRKAARNFAETAHLADAPESAEHREKYSMGGGYYLKAGYRHSTGWQVSKRSFYGSGPIVKQLPLAEWSLGQPEAEPVAAVTAPNGMRIEEHSHTKKGFQMFIAVLPDRVERDEFDRLRDTAKALGGWYSRPWGSTPGGFAFKDKASAERFAGAGATNEAVAPSDKPARPVAGMGDKLRDLAERLQGEIDRKFAPRLSNTPKRQREADSARLDGYHLQRTQQALRALTALHDAGTVPPVLAKVTTKARAMDLTRSRIDRTNAGYYDAGIDTGEPATDSPEARALWSLIGAQGEEERKAEELRRKVNALQFANISGYFPTPAAVIEQMIFHADMPVGEFDMLEPEGGSGAILDMVRARFKEARLTTYEQHSSLREVLKLKGYTLAGSDFLEATPSATFDRVLMNPPFERLQDIEHVVHAFAFLKPGGRLVAIMSPGPFFRQDGKSAKFREWFEAHGGEKFDIPAGAFKESGTGVATVLVVLDK